MRALLSALLALACAVESSTCPPLDPPGGWSRKLNLSRTCPIDEFDPPAHPRCTDEAVRYDDDPCSETVLFWCSGYTWTSYRYAADDGLRAFETQRQIDGECRIEWERRERS